MSVCEGILVHTYKLTDWVHQKQLVGSVIQEAQLVANEHIWPKIHTKLIIQVIFTR